MELQQVVVPPAATVKVISAQPIANVTKFVAGGLFKIFRSLSGSAQLVGGVLVSLQTGRTGVPQVARNSGKLIGVILLVRLLASRLRPRKPKLANRQLMQDQISQLLDGVDDPTILKRLQTLILADLLRISASASFDDLAATMLASTVGHTDMPQLQRQLAAIDDGLVAVYGEAEVREMLDKKWTTFQAVVKDTVEQVNASDIGNPRLSYPVTEQLGDSRLLKGKIVAKEQLEELAKDATEVEQPDKAKKGVDECEARFADLLGHMAH